MIRFTFLCAAAIVAVTTATPALAQAVIEEPGMYAFYHPNGDLGIGSARPADAMASIPLGNSGHMAGLRMGVRSHPVLAKRGPSIKRY